MDYRRNEDKLCQPKGDNALLSIKQEEDNPVEPVTLAEVKSHLRIDFTDDDVYLGMLTTSCRQSLEKFTGLSLVEKTITVQISNLNGNYELPYGPVVGITSVKDKEETVLIEDDDYELSGIEHISIAWPNSAFLVIEYTAGYEEVPADLKLELLKMIAWEYSHRGDESNEKYQFTNKARQHRRIPFII